ncbi:MAG TPA: HD domain-containing phosphohydrolase [Candidatus Limnocylindria bacterium]|nr:HD domain-containing phosphohydrolase [Candidatus Limnocylindria bacterium]
MILVVDDHDLVRERMVEALAALDYEVRQVSDGREALGRVRLEPPDLVLTDMQMPDLDGIALCREIKTDPVLRLIPVVVVTSEPSLENELAAIAAGADGFFAKPATQSVFAARIGVLVRERALNQRLDPAENVLFATARAVAARNPYALAHSERVAQYARALGFACRLPSEECELLYMAGLLHDIGKIGVPDAILLKQGPLDPEELKVMREHPVLGEWICSSLQSVRPALPIIRHHHERFDGTGYPDGLRENEIPYLARISAVADAWDAMLTARPYRGERTEAEACGELVRGAGTQWDPALVETFTQLARRGDIRSLTNPLA